jgi:ketosteroid isomerase-like protein
MEKPLEIVKRFYALTDPRGRDIPGLLGPIASLLTEDIRFTGPLMRTEGRDQYLVLLGQFLAAHVGYTVHRQFESGDDFCSIYHMTVRTPSGDTLTVAMVDWLKVRNGRICEQKLYYDPRAFARAFGMEAA